MNCFLVRAADDGPRVQFEQDEFKSMAVTCTWPRSTHMLERHDPDNECGWTHPEWDQAAMIQHAMEAHLVPTRITKRFDTIPRERSNDMVLRQVGWIGHRDGTVYSLDEKPLQNGLEGGGISPLYESIGIWEHLGDGHYGIKD